MVTDKNAQVAEITAKIEDGVKAIFTSEKYAEYLKTMAKFHSYSTRNTLLIHLQMPQATHVCGFQGWQQKFNRTVKRGEHAIKIFAPVPISIKKEAEVIDEQTQKPVIGEDGNPLVREIEIKLPKFKVVNVFDVSQTEGDPLPELLTTLDGNVNQYDIFVDALRRVCPLPIEFAPLSPDMDGLCINGDKIQIRQDMSEIQTVLAFIHEITHAKLHDKTIQSDEPQKTDRASEEVTAESVAYTVCQYFGLETNENSFAYIANWSSGRDVKELQASLDIIRKTSTELINAIETNFKELSKEREVNAEIMEAEAAIEANIEPAIESVSEMKPEYKSETVLMPLLYDDGMLNRSGKRTRVQTEPPIGNYAIYTRMISDTRYSCVMTESGKLIDFGRTEDVANVTVEQLDNFFSRLRDRFDYEMNEPHEWVDFMGAAVMNKIAEADEHNAVVKVYREEKKQAERAEQEKQRRIEENQKAEAFENKLDEIEKGILSGEKIDVEVEKYKDPNPLLALFERHKMTIPPKTKGWITKKLTAFQVKGVEINTWAYMKKNNEKISDVYMSAIFELRDRIILKNREKQIQEPEKAVETTIEPQTEPQKEFEIRPDYSITDEKLREFGYPYDGMFPLSEVKAAELYDSSLPIYLLYPDGTESLVIERSEILTHEGMYGVERDDFKASMIYADMQKFKNCEQELLSGGEMFAVYQVRDGVKSRFMSLKELEKSGGEVDFKNYDLIYADSYAGESLDSIFKRFNCNNPADYHGHTLSMSDVVVTSRGGDISAFYSDRFGFERLQNFTGKETPVKQKQSLINKLHTKQQQISNGQVRDKTAKTNREGLE